MAHAWTNLFTARGEFEHFDTKSPTTSLLNELETGQTRRFDSDRSNLHCLRIPDGVTVLCHRPICPGRIFPALPTRDHTKRYKETSNQFVNSLGSVSLLLLRQPSKLNRQWKCIVNSISWSRSISAFALGEICLRFCLPSSTSNPFLALKTDRISIRYPTLPKSFRQKTHFREIPSEVLVFRRFRL